MAKTSKVYKLTSEEVGKKRIYIKSKELNSFYPELGKEIKLIFGMTEISATIQKEEVSEKKKRQVINFIKMSHDLNFMTNDKIKVIKLAEDTFEIQKLGK